MGDETSKHHQSVGKRCFRITQALRFSTLRIRAIILLSLVMGVARNGLVRGRKAEHCLHPRR